MRRNFVLVTVLAIMFVASITLAAKNGAVKSPLVETFNGGQSGGVNSTILNGQPGGWVLMNINAKGVLIVTMHLDVPGAPDDAVQDIWVDTLFGTSGTVDPFMTLNAAGKGTKQIKVQLTGLDGTDTVSVWADTLGGAGGVATDPSPTPVPVPKSKNWFSNHKTAYF